MTSPFLARVATLLAGAGWSPGESPATMLDRWSGFVEECRQGYGWDLSEYDNELRVRDRIELVLGDAQLRATPERGMLAEEVALVDDRFRALLLEGVERPGASWWERGVLRRAGEEYASDVLRTYGIRVPEVGSP